MKKKKGISLIVLIVTIIGSNVFKWCSTLINISFNVNMYRWCDYVITIK